MGHGEVLKMEIRMSNLPNTQDRLSQLKNRINYLMQVSRDAAFTEYLKQMRGRVANHERELDLLAGELERRVQMYESTMQARNGAAVRSVPQPVPGPAPQQTVQPVPQRTVQPAPRQTVQAAHFEGQRRSAEFAVWAAVLSIVGSIFILTAMVLLGIYFMEGLVKGLLLYAVCLIVMILSEILLYRRWPKLGMTFSAIGMCGLYISTLINYLVLQNMNFWVALGLNLVITAAVVLLSRRRDAAAYRILGMLAVYACLLLMFEVGNRTFGRDIPSVQFLTVTVTILMINLMCLLVPVKKSHTAIYVTHMALNTIFTFVACCVCEVEDSWQYFLFILLSALVMQLIFVLQVRWQNRRTPGCPMEANVGICVTYGISSLLYCLMFALSAADIDMKFAFVAEEYSFLVSRLICSAAVVFVCLIPMLALPKRQEKWFAWYLLNLTLLFIYAGAADITEFYLCVLVLLLASKLLSFTKRQMVCNCDAAVTLVACVIVLFSWDSVKVVPLAAGLLLSVFCVNYWRVYFEGILTLTLALYTSFHMLPALKLPVFVGIVFVGMLLYNNIKRWHGRGMIGYNIVMLLAQGVCYLLLFNPIYRNSYLTYLCMLIFGAATLVICLQDRYHLECGIKPLIIAVFLTYMGLVTRSSYPIVNSILLMVIALACVGVGFAIKKKSIRIYGLVLSLTVCAKLVLYDFMGGNILQKTILFFVVGLLALMIGAIYMILEWSQDKKNLPRENKL